MDRFEGHDEEEEESFEVVSDDDEDDEVEEVVMEYEEDEDEDVMEEMEEDVDLYSEEDHEEDWESEEEEVESPPNRRRTNLSKPGDVDPGLPETPFNIDSSFSSFHSIHLEENPVETSTTTTTATWTPPHIVPGGQQQSSSSAAPHQQQQSQQQQQQPIPWLQRDANDPDDLIYACRRLVAILYHDHDNPEEYDVDTMLRRSTPLDLFRYLKNEYWFLVHTGKWKENQIAATDSGNLTVVPSSSSMTSTSPSETRGLPALEVMMKKIKEESSTRDLVGNIPPNIQHNKVMMKPWPPPTTTTTPRIVEPGTRAEVGRDPILRRGSIDSEDRWSTSAESFHTDLWNPSDRESSTSSTSSAIMDVVTTPTTTTGTTTTTTTTTTIIEELSPSTTTTTTPREYNQPSLSIQSSEVEVEDVATHHKESDVDERQQDTAILPQSMKSKSSISSEEDDYVQSARVVAQSLLYPSSSEDATVNRIEEEDDEEDDGNVDRLSDANDHPTSRPQTSDEEPNLMGSTKRQGLDSDESTRKKSRQDEANVETPQPSSTTVRSPVETSTMVATSSGIARLFDLDESNLQDIIEDEMMAIIQQTEVEEMNDEPIDVEVVDVLIRAARQVVYCKKYYDVCNDRMIYLPPSIHAIADYTLLDVAADLYSYEPDDFPDVYSGALRAVASRHLENLSDLDFDYMLKLAIDFRQSNSAAGEEGGGGEGEGQSDFENLEEGKQHEAKVSQLNAVSVDVPHLTSNEVSPLRNEFTELNQSPNPGLIETYVRPDPHLHDSQTQLHQPYDSDMVDVSLHPKELFVKPAMTPPPEKPLLAAALKAKADLASSPSNGATPAHLAYMHQPLSSAGLAERSLHPNELFSSTRLPVVEEKPLLAAALKAKAEMEGNGTTMQDPTPSHLADMNQTPPPEKPLLAAALQAKADMAGSPSSNGATPPHLAHMHQPSSTAGVAEGSLHPRELFSSNRLPAIEEKPLLAAALKAKAEMEENGTTVQSTTPRHLADMNQPVESVSDNVSLHPKELFVKPAMTPPPEKPLLAAALKAKSDAARSTSNEATPPHLAYMHQPPSTAGLAERSLHPNELFSSNQLPAIEGKPLLAAALKAKAEMEGNGTSGQGLTPRHLHDLNQPLESVSDNVSLHPKELFVKPTMTPAPEKALLAAAQKAKADLDRGLSNGSTPHMDGRLVVSDVPPGDGIKSISGRTNGPYVGSESPSVEHRGLATTAANSNFADLNAIVSGTTEPGSDRRSIDTQMSMKEDQLREKTQILEFKRRTDKVKLEKMADELLAFRHKVEEKRLAETSRLTFELKLAMDEIESSATALGERYRSRTSALHQQFAKLSAAFKEQDAVLVARIREVKQGAEVEVQEASSERTALEEKLLATSRQQQVLFDRLDAAHKQLEDEKRFFEASLHQVESQDKEKGGIRSVFGRRKQQDLEKQRATQAIYMEWKLREAELLRRIRDVDLEHVKAKEELHKIDLALQSLELQRPPESPQSLHVAELERERENLGHQFESAADEANREKALLDERHEQDVAWTFEEKNEANLKHNEGLRELEYEVQDQLATASAMETKIREVAMGFREKWLAEEAELARDIEERSNVAEGTELGSDTLDTSVSQTEQARSPEQEVRRQTHENAQVEVEDVARRQPDLVRLVPDRDDKISRSGLSRTTANIAEENGQKEQEEQVVDDRAGASGRVGTFRGKGVEAEETVEQNQTSPFDSVIVSRNGITVEEETAINPLHVELDSAGYRHLDQSSKTETSETPLQPLTAFGARDSSFLGEVVALKAHIVTQIVEAIREKESSHSRGPGLSDRRIPKRKPKPGGGLAERLLSEAKVFVDSSHNRSFDSCFIGSQREADVKSQDPMDTSLPQEAHVANQGSFENTKTDPTELDEFSSQVLVLYSSTPTTRAQAVAQERSMVILRSHKILFDKVDGGNPDQMMLRKALSQISGKGGLYPQFFIRTIDNQYTYVGDWHTFESANENGELIEIMKGSLDSRQPDDETFVDNIRSESHEDVAQPKDDVDIEFDVVESTTPALDRFETKTHIHAHDEVPTPIIANVRKSIENLSEFEADRSTSLATGNVGDTQSIRDQGRIRNSDRLEVWRTNGKRLVEEKHASSLVRRGADSSGTNHSSSRTSLQNEKLRAITERREEALLRRSAIKASEQGITQPQSREESSPGDVKPSLSTLEEKRKRASEARVRAMAARAVPRGMEGVAPRVVEAGAPRGMEAVASSPTRMKETETQTDMAWTSNQTDLSWTSTQVAHDHDEGGIVFGDESSTMIMYPLVQEAECLADSITRNEKKLENLCQAMILMTEGTVRDDLPSSSLWKYTSEQEWFRRHSSKQHSTPSVASSSSNALADVAGDTMIQLSSLARTFLEMDGPLGGDMGRLLNSILRQTNETFTISALRHHWEQLSTLAGDTQSLRIYSKMDELLTTCLQANLVVMKSTPAFHRK